jgi:hypothetical protein
MDVFLFFVQAGADEVWCNDYNPGNRKALMYNLLSSISLDGSDDHSIAGG